jgi:hypothetical protein
MCITSVNGLNTIIPSIDSQKNSTSVTSNLGTLNVNVNMNRVNNNILPTSHNYSGYIGFSPSIPSGKCVTISLSGITESICGASTICFTCKPNGSSSDICIYSNSNTQSQPQSTTIVARYGDTICYCGVLTASVAGSISTQNICISNLTSTIGINPIRTIPYDEYTCICQPPVSEVLSICRVNSLGGYINLLPTLTQSNQSVTVGVCFNQTAKGTSSATANIYCRPTPAGSYALVCKFQTTSSGSLNCGTGGFNLNIPYGSSICFDNTATGSSGTCSSVKLCNASGSFGLNPTICSLKCVDDFIII